MKRRMNNLHANCIQIARKKYNLPMIVRGYRETEPQMNADLLNGIFSNIPKMENRKAWIQNFRLSNTKMKR